MSKLSLFAVATDSRIDAEAGVLRGVSLISKGIAKGHTFLGEPIIADDITLDEVSAAAQSFADGVPVNFDHGTGIEDLVGAIRGVYRDGDKVRGDLYLLRSHESFETILEMAETMPSNFGLSISFMNAPVPVLGKDMEPDGDEDDDTLAAMTAEDIVAYAARVCELYGADLVKNPATGNGLFQAAMTETTTAEAPAEEIPAETAPEVAQPAEAPKSPEAPAAEETTERAIKELSADPGEVKSSEAPAETASEAKPDEEEAPDRVENPLVLAPEELARLKEIETNFSANRTELSTLRSELSALRSELSVKEAQLVELNMLHRSVKSVLGLLPADEIPVIEDSAPELSIVEQYESMSPGANRLAFFERNRRELEKAISSRLAK